MDPLYEQRLRDEVIFLHSLWHQGPPPSTPTHFTFRRHLHPLKTTPFKKGNKRGARGEEKGNPPPDGSNSSSAAEWPCPTPEEWPRWETKPDANPQLLSLEDQLKFVSKNAHKGAQRVVNDFFRSGNGDDSDAIDSDTDEDNDDLMVEDDGREYFCFFFKVFEDNSRLKEYYEKNFVTGEFTCLVCGASRGKNAWKKYRGCLPLVQHSISIAKTKKRRAHRALGQAICKVLGWDIDQLPNIASLLSTMAGEAEVNASVNKEKSVVVVNNVDAANGDEFKVKNDGAVLENESIVAGVLSNGDGGNVNSLVEAGKGLDNPRTVHPPNLEVPASENLTNNSLTCPDACKDLNDPNTVHPHNMEVPTSEGLTSNSPENLMDSHPLNVEKPIIEGLTNVSEPSDGDQNSENRCLVCLENVEGANVTEICKCDSRWHPRGRKRTQAVVTMDHT